MSSRNLELLHNIDTLFTSQSESSSESEEIDEDSIDLRSLIIECMNYFKGAIEDYSYKVQEIKQLKCFKLIHGIIENEIHVNIYGGIWPELNEKPENEDPLNPYFYFSQLQQTGERALDKMQKHFKNFELRQIHKQFEAYVGIKDHIIFITESLENCKDIYHFKATFMFQAELEGYEPEERKESRCTSGFFEKLFKSNKQLISEQTLEFGQELEALYDNYFELMSIAEQKVTYLFINAVLMDANEIILDQVEITEYGIHLLSIILLDAKSLIKLNLNSTSINLSIKSCEYLSKTLKRKSKIKELSLSRVGLNDSSLLILIEGIKLMQGLRLLDLSHNQITCEGCNIIIDTLFISSQKDVKYCKFIRTLNLSHNLISDKGAISFADFIRSNKSLSILYLNDNQICAKATKGKSEATSWIIQMSRALDKNIYLKEIHLYGNGINKQLQILLKNKHLERIFLEDSFM